jgi:hypothetical protein
LKLKRNTSTVGADGKLVPWLATEGALAYTHATPPETDYFFQYSWILPEIFSSAENRRKHFYFGDYEKPSELFRFWGLCRRGGMTPVQLRHGERAEGSVTAPIAIFRHAIDYPSDPNGYLFVQHGSYQEVESTSQPEIASGFVRLYRGIQNAALYDHFSGRATTSKQAASRKAYLDLQWQMMSDSIVSFTTIHDRAKRSETEHIKDRSWISDKLAADAGLDIESDEWLSLFWTAAHQSFALERWVAERKFGPNFVMFRTPITNVRLTTFFAGEKEVRIIDPAKLEFVEAFGCSFRES